MAYAKMTSNEIHILGINQGALPGIFCIAMRIASAISLARFFVMQKHSSQLRHFSFPVFFKTYTYAPKAVSTMTCFSNL